MDEVPAQLEILKVNHINQIVDEYDSLSPISRTCSAAST